LLIWAILIRPISDISCGYKEHDVLRVSGQGAGVAAAKSTKMGTICRQTPIEEIQKELAKQNVRFDY
jgi:hypothetical protein